MSNLTNITKVYLLRVPLENDYKHTLYFESADEQHDYFMSRVYARYTDFNYIRKDNVLHVPSVDSLGLVTEYDDILKSGANYVAYQNTKFSNKWFYCFIKDIRYVSNGVTALELETDVMQTYMFDIKILPSFVEREHTADDTIGLNTVDEGLELGDMVCNGQNNVDLGKTYIVVATTKYLDTSVAGTLYSGSYSGVKYYACPVNSYARVNEYLASMAERAASDAIVSIFLLPAFLLPGADEIGDTLDAVTGGNTAVTKTIGFNSHINTTLEDYYPTNNKLFCYPFNYLLASNHNGSDNVYKYEYFKNETPTTTFKLYGAITPSGSIKLIPTNYMGQAENLNEGLNAGKFPICNWNTDVYTNWLTQNSVNYATSMAGGFISAAGGLATGNIAMASSGIGGIISTLDQKRQARLTPNASEGNLNAGDVVTAMGRNTFTLYQMSIRGEVAKRIDEFLTMFGYKTLNVKVPNKAHRKYFWYTKTQEINIDGTVPLIDIQKIKDNYNNGITFWRGRYADKIQDYSVDNFIIENPEIDLTSEE